MVPLDYRTPPPSTADWRLLYPLAGTAAAAGLCVAGLLAWLHGLPSLACWAVALPLSCGSALLGNRYALRLIDTEGCLTTLAAVVLFLVNALLAAGSAVGLVLAWWRR